MIKISERIGGKWLKILSNGKTFLMFSFINAFSPIFLCIIASFIPYFGAQAVMGVGYVTPFQLGFVQMAISFATWTFYNLIKNRQNKNIEFKKKDFDFVISTSIYLALIVGVIITILYSASSYSYMYFSTNRPNTKLSLFYGYDYINTTIPYLLFVCFKSILVMYVYYHYKNLSFYFESAFAFFSLLLSYALGVYSGLEVNGMGIGLSLSLIIYIIFLIAFIKFKCPFKFYKFKRSSIKESNLVLKDILSEASGSISMSFFKGLALLMLGLIIPNKLQEYVPLSYQMARVIWFNYMYALPFIAVGIATAIEFYDLYDVNPGLETKMKRKYWLLTLIAMILSFVLAVPGEFLVEPLARLYVQNSSITKEMLPPVVEGMPLDINNLPPTKFPQIPNDIYTATNLKDFAKAFHQWLTAPEMKEWKEWISSNKALELWALNHPEEFAGWMVNYILYTSYDVSVINALINLRTSSDIATPDSILLFALTYNSKTYIYISIYCVLYSGWTILLPSTTKISQKKLPTWLVIIVYAVAIGFVITFGIIFALYFETWWPNVSNPFMYMDAWTFPCAVVAVIVSIYVWIKWTYICIKDNKKFKVKFI